MDVEIRDRLIPFLQELVISMEEDRLEERQINCVEDFFIAYQFQTQAVKDTQTCENNTTEQISREEIVQFITLAWYVYRLLCDNRTL